MTNIKEKLSNKGIWNLACTKTAIISIIVMATACKSNINSDFNIKNYGAKGNKEQLVSAQIQKAIDECFEAGGGRVYFPPGNYLTGTIVLKDNVTLYLEAGATLFASKEEKDFDTPFKVYKKNDSGKKGKGETPVLIYAKNAKNISIEGKGTIDGQAVRSYEDLKEVDGFIRDITEKAKKAGVEMKMYYKTKPYTCLVFFESCENIKIHNISLIESMDWTLHFKWCKKVFIDNIYLFSSLESGVNADGIDVDGCKDVVITNSIIETGDDAIVLKSTQTDTTALSCENVTVNNCVLTSTSTALKIGTETFGDFRHITFSNCVVRNSNRGISIVVRDGAMVENVLFSDITMETNRKHFNWWGNGDAIWIVLLKRSDDSKLGMIRNITMRNIVAHSQGTSKIEGFEGKPIENIELANIQFFMHNENYADKRTDDAFYSHDVKNLRVRDCDVTWNDDIIEPKWKNAFSFKQIEGLLLSGLSGKQAPTDSASFILLNDTRDVCIEHCRPLDGTTIFLQVEGAKSSNIILNDNYTENAEKLINIINGANTGIIRKL